MERPNPDACLNDVAWCRRIALLVVFALAAMTWVGWATGIDRLTRVDPAWPQMMPWTALWLLALGAAIVFQSGRPSRGRVWAGRGSALVVGSLAVITLLEYAAGGPSSGLDLVWFGDAVRTSQQTWPGRPSAQTASSVVPLAAAAALIRVDRGARVVWPACMAAGGAVPFVTVGAYLFGALSLVGFSPSTGQALMTAVSLLLLAAATSLARPDRSPVAWLLARPDRKSLIRLVGILAGFPVVVALARPFFLRLGLGQHAEWTFSILLGTAIVGAITFFFIQREQKLLIEKELVSKERADAEARYRILADNAVDIIVHLRGGEVAWVSPSVEAALGRPPQDWTGSDFDRHIHPADLETVTTALGRVAAGESVLQRFRVRSTDGNYHWVEGHGKPYIDAEGNIDGLIAAVRIIDEQVEAEQRLERMARFDMLTGLVNRAEALDRLASALEQPQPAGTYVGVLFCDVDHFKEINDTWGHGVGDSVLATLAARIQEGVRQGDTVGRTGGDEILVLLPGVRSIDELTHIAEKIRCRAAEPIGVSGQTFSATLSIGATLAIPGDSVDTITARADAAMYQAKLGDRNTIVRN
ncbi:diguanylate cyclase domain-containing protein [Mycobacterium nebraskense]|uniref:Diguanylate cyclase n=1 Tax=Mycobacterium nebraskense TaxID=244292 RepID=A0A0F5N6Z1_9MYCO|nr:diguanylate cyclase [Mycobacterium nebraskense]KKC02640.1 diguanylate cyclase [Mycobacterium nebraskense]KLO39701.1 diguanylate cyclase [Mycobacterium nebraskense]MBI2695439.1 sensor domain-containing diguanylate cyclase [Mycobacterium nebraskense]MCV7121419.1 sensor domain-containing diguanylate cyclase [Mycobacterium nebraskense]ORW30247.1 diguanylate cyclase [Mycobacterium nebraskense]